MHHINPVRKRLHADIHRLLSTLMQSDVNDPRLSGACITRIEPKASGHDLIVWVHRINDEDHNATEQRLNKLSPHFMYRMRHALPNRRLPRIHFRWDEALDRGDAVLRRIREIEKKAS